MASRRQSCIVIGAGLAGLSAGQRLKERGWKVTVVEADTRPGGRVYTHEGFAAAPKLVCELGAEWIGDHHTRIRALCRRYKLPLRRHRFEYAFCTGGRATRFYRPGAWSFKFNKNKWRKLKRKFEHMDPAQCKDLDQMDWYNYLHSIGFTGRDLKHRELMDSTDSGESIRFTSAYSAGAEYFEGSPTNEMDWKVRGGNKRLIEALMREVGDVRLGCTVHTIAQKGTRVRIRATGIRETLEADHCICTAPAPCLLPIEWEPELPPEKIDAIEQLQYSRITKTAVLFADRFWDKARGRHRKYGFAVFNSRVTDFCFDSTHGQRGPQGIICSYSIGDKADDIASERPWNVKRWIRNDLGEFVGAKKQDDVGRVLDIAVQAWQTAAWRGAYAFYRPGQWFTLRPILQNPHRRVFFAGEHLSDEFQGFMEGAVQTGQDAADQL